MYRIIIEEGVRGILFAGTKKQCLNKLPSFINDYPNAIIEKVENSFSYAMKYFTKM